MANYNSYVHCFVRGCRNTSVTAPNKLFFNVPTGVRRIDWFKVAGREDESLSLIAPYRCCADHFVVEEDVLNWWQYKILRDAGAKNFRLRLKRDALPHIFNHSSDDFEEPPSCFHNDDIEPLEFVDVGISSASKSMVDHISVKEEPEINVCSQNESTSSITDDETLKLEYTDDNNLCDLERITEDVCNEAQTKDFSCQTKMKPKLQMSKIFTVSLPSTLPVELEKEMKVQEMGAFFC